MAVAAARRRAHGDEDRIRALHRAVEVGREGEPAGMDVVLHQLVEPRLEDRHRAGLQAVDLGASLSTQTTSRPNSEKQAPETRPT